VLLPFARVTTRAVAPRYPVETLHPLLPLSTQLTTERLILRPARPADVPALRYAARKNLAHLRPWTARPAAGEDPTTLTAVSKEVVSARRAWKVGAGHAFWMFDPETDERVLGRVQLSSIVRGAFHNAYLGYWCDDEHQGRGLTTEAVRAVVACAFEQLELHRVQAAVMPRNAPSLRVLAKLGFRLEGRAERYLQIAGTWEDHDVFALTREEWPVTEPTAH
jgi:ribosomal-protein-alanine N-acetyltransferase